MQVIEFISQPWHWAASGVAIVMVMFLLTWFGQRFGVSSNLKHLCAMGGAGDHTEFFNYNWKAQSWNLIFIFGAVIGGMIATQYLASPEPVQISESTTTFLTTHGIDVPTTLEQGAGFVPAEIFSIDSFTEVRNLIILIIGGFLIGFGTRYAGGCTSGHAISGLSNLQIPSLVAVIGFFIGGLSMTWLILPHIFNL